VNKGEDRGKLSKHHAWLFQHLKLGRQTFPCRLNLFEVEV